MHKSFASLLLMSCGLLSAAPTMFQVQVFGHGKPMLLIPGLASSGDVWKSTVARYGDQYECHVVTLAGFAAVPPVKDYSLSAVEHDLSSYIAEKKLGKPVIVGHSLGGFLALSLAAHHPEQVGSLIIVDSLPAMGAAANPAATPADLEKMADQMKAGMLAENEEQRTKSGRMAVETMVTKPADVELVDSWGKTSDWHTEVIAMSEMMATDLRPELKLITAPTLVMGTWVAYAQYGGEAGITQTFKGQYERLSGVKIKMAPKARHFIMYDDPAWMFAQMDDFLKAR